VLIIEAGFVNVKTFQDVFLVERSVIKPLKLTRARHWRWSSASLGTWDGLIVDVQVTRASVFISCVGQSMCCVHSRVVITVHVDVSQLPDELAAIDGLTSFMRCECPRIHINLFTYLVAVLVFLLSIFVQAIVRATSFDQVCFAGAGEQDLDVALNLLCT